MGCPGSGPSEDPASEPTPPPTAEPAADGAGAAVYTQYCAFCHGDSGEGYLADNAPALANANFLATASDDFLRAAVVEGRPGTPMSAWGRERGGPLDAEQVDQVVAYMRAWQTTPSIALPPHDATGSSALRGRGPYRVHCAGCHGDEGQGVSAVSLNNPWLLETASDAFLSYAIREGRPGTPMPAFGAVLPERAQRDIVALIRSWQLPVSGEIAPPFEPDMTTALIHPDGADPTWPVREERFVGADDIHAALEAGEAMVILDARPTSDYLHSHVTGSTSLPFYDIDKYVEMLPRDRWIITYCGCPHAVSGQLADALRDRGFERVAVLDEGFYEWESRGYGVTVAGADEDAAAAVDGSGEGAAAPADAPPVDEPPTAGTP